MPATKMQCPLCGRYTIQTSGGFAEAFGGSREDQDERMHIRPEDDEPPTRFRPQAPLGFKRVRTCSACQGWWISIELPYDFVQHSVQVSRKIATLTLEKRGLAQELSKLSSVIEALRDLSVEQGEIIEELAQWQLVNAGEPAHTSVDKPTGEQRCLFDCLDE